MSRKLLYINNTLVDLFPDTVIAQSLQAFEIGELGSVRANYTNQIKIPKSATNRRALQFSDDSKSSTSFPYTSYSARYVEDGIEVIRNGSVILKESDEAFILHIFSGPIGFFDFIKTRKLWDLDTTDINSGWTDTDRDAVRNATTGMVAPLIDDGLITYSGVTLDIDHTGGVTKHPWIYYHTVIDKIFSGAGYTKEGSIFSDDKYLKLALPMKTTFSPVFTNAKGFHAAALGTQVIVNPTSYTNIQFPSVLSQGEDEFYDGTDDYIVDNPDTTEEYFPMIFRSVLTITVTGGTVDIIIAKNNFPTVNQVLNTGTPVNGVGSGTYTLSANAVGNSVMKDGDAVSIRVIAASGTPTVTITNGIFEGYMPEWASLPDYIYFNHLFDDINQADFLKDFSVRFNVKMIERNGVIVCKTMDEILAEAPNAVDWTDKRASDKNKVRYEFPSLARSNYFKYGTDDLVEDVSSDFGKGVIEVANENLKESQDIYESMFSLSEMIMFSDQIFIAKMQAGAEVNSLGIRLLYLRDGHATEEPGVVYNLNTRHDFKVGYFIDPRQDHSMHWQYFIDNYYAGFAAKLQKAKLVNRDYKLSVVDIHTFDQLKPIYDNGELFIVTRINNFIPGKMTDVELFKIN